MAGINLLRWKKIGDQDWEYQADDYLLRAEKMNKKHWWFQCYHKDVELVAETYARDKRTAMERAELAMLRHWISNLQNNLK